MKVVIIGASGKTGARLVRESLKRDYPVVAVCRTSSAERITLPVRSIPWRTLSTTGAL